MSTKTRILLILLAVGIVGIAATMGVIVGSDTLMSREAEKTYVVAKPFNSVRADAVLGQVEVLPVESGEVRVEAYAKAWLSHEIDMDGLVNVAVKDGVLVVTETPFPSEFFGVFPQPYELNLRVYVPQNVYEGWTGGKQ